MPPKKMKTLTIPQKLLIRKSKKTTAELAIEYGVSQRTIQRILSNDSLEVKVSKIEEAGGDISRRMRLKEAEFPEMETCLYIWFCQMREKGIPMSGPILEAQGMHFHDKLKYSKPFVASNGWVENFKNRHGIKWLGIQGEQMSADAEAAAHFPEKLQDIIEEGEYSLHNVYNADETGLFWKCLPWKTLACRGERMAKGQKVPKDRVTAMFAGNATGTHKVEPLIIGKAANPHGFKQSFPLPLHYWSQAKAWMTLPLFTRWFREVFIPAVKLRQQEDGLIGPVLLIVDNCSAHTAEEQLNIIHEGFTVMFLPPNVTSLIQPMDQGPIEITKRWYRRFLLENLLVGREPDEVQALYKGFNLLKAVHLFYKAWYAVEGKCYARAWRKLFGPGWNGDSYDLTDPVPTDYLELAIESLPGCGSADSNDMERWLQVDRYEPGHGELQDDEIIAEVRGVVNSDKIEAVDGLDKFISWANTSISLPDHLQEALQEIRALADQY